jgi:hypothetical protein
MTPPRIAAFAVLALAGCGPSAGPPLAPVSGTVTLDGKPLSGAVVSFIPTGDTPGGGGDGRTGPDGKYTLRSRHGGGVAAGEYRVVVSKRVMPNGSDVPPDDPTPPSESPAREILPYYSDRSSPVLTATVPTAGATVDLPLQSRGKPR